MRNVFHGLEPVVGIAELCQYQSIMLVLFWVFVLEPVLVAREAPRDYQRVIKAFGNVAVEKARADEPVSEAFPRRSSSVFASKLTIPAIIKLHLL